jgi:cyclase
VREIAPNVFIETGYRLVNVGAILTGDGWVLVDAPPYPRDAQHWRDCLAEVAPLPVLALILTDGQRDRLLGACWFGARTIVGHEETLTQIANLPQTFFDSASDVLASNAPERDEFAEVRLLAPNIGFTERMELRYGGWHIPLLAMAGPTAGSAWVHLPEQRVLFAGPSICVDEHPTIASCSTKDWLETLTELRRPRFAADVIVPGRGQVVDKSATEPISNYLRVARRRVYSLFRAGRPRADTAALVPELLEMFPYDASDSENVQRRIKSGLDRIYEEFKTSDRANDLSAR